ncbi:MAG: T9SS type A sorting domain-containing protein [Candidatus Eisenbacteria bacterium]|nr:T9SS type A sorting domain-containing protein [Candidatus Eisenbacteria bacterium]
MRRARWLLVIALLLVPGVSHALQLHWSSGADTLTFTEATRAILVLRADSAEVTLPPEWRLMWVGDSTEVEVVALDSLAVCAGDTAQVYGVEGPVTPEDSTAHRVTARFCSGGSSAAEQASYQLDLPAWGRGKCKVVALDPADSSSVLESNEVTFNGGVSGDFAPALLSASFTHSGGDLSVTAIGTGLADASAMALSAPDTSWRMPLTITQRSANRAVATGYLGIPVPDCNLDVAGSSEGLATTAVSAETEAPTEPMAPVGSSAKFVPAYGIVQPKDFAFYYQQQLGIFHVFYIVSNRVILSTPGYGADSTEKCIGHAWSTDLEHWTSMDSVLTIRSDKWDNAHIWAPTIVQKDLQFKLFYTGVHRDPLGRQIQQIGLATADATLPHDSLKTWTRRDSAVFHCGMVPWANKNTSVYEGQQFRDPFVMADSDSVGRYLMYYVTIHKDETAKMVVGLARSSGDLSAWRNYGPMHGTEQQYTGSTNDIVESPNLLQHYDVTSGTMSRWLFLTTNTNQAQEMHFQRTLGSPSDTLAAPWLPTTDLFTYLDGDSTVYYWHATEYLPVPARIGGYATTHEFLAAYDDSTWAIDINEILWDANPPAPYYADFTLAYPSLAAVDPGTGEGHDGARLLLLGRQPVVNGAHVAVDLPTAAHASVTVLDVQGRSVRTLVRGVLPAGRTTARWDARGDDGQLAPSGVYFVRLNAEGLTRTTRLVLLH